MLGDNKFEIDETFIVEITSALGAREGSPGTGTIVNDDKVATRLTVRDHVRGTHVAVRGRLLHGAKGSRIRVVLMRMSWRPVADGRSSRRHHARPGTSHTGRRSGSSVTERSSDMSILVVTASARSSAVMPPTPTPARISASASRSTALRSAQPGRWPMSTGCGGSVSLSVLTPSRDRRNRGAWCPGRQSPLPSRSVCDQGERRRREHRVQRVPRRSRLVCMFLFAKLGLVALALERGRPETDRSQR